MTLVQILEDALNVAKRNLALNERMTKAFEVNTYIANSTKLTKYHAGL